MIFFLLVITVNFCVQSNVKVKQKKKQKRTKRRKAEIDSTNNISKQ